MAFTQSTFSIVGAASTAAPTVYAYRTSDDIATITSADYFEQKVFQLEQGDFVLADCSDGNIAATVNADSKTITRIDSSEIPTDGLSVWLDPSDLSTLYQDDAGTTPVTADGDPVGRIEDKSGNGYHATQSNAANKAVYKTDGTKHWLEFAGNTDFYDISTSYDGAVGDSNTAVIGARDTTSGSAFFLNKTSNRGFILLLSNTRIRVLANTTSGIIAQTGTTVTVNNDIVFSADWNRSAGQIRGWLDRVKEVDTTGTPADKLTGASAWVSDSGSGKFDGRIYGITVYNTLLSDSDREAVEDYMAVKAGVTLP